MFKFFKQKKQERESFISFLMSQSRMNPALSLEDALDFYIERYSLQIQHSFDEPNFVIEKRTKLKILEESLLSDPENFDAPELHQYINDLRILVETFNSLSPEALKAMKKKEG